MPFSGAVAGAAATKAGGYRVWECERRGREYERGEDRQGVGDEVLVGEEGGSDSSFRRRTGGMGTGGVIIPRGRRVVRGGKGWRRFWWRMQIP